MAQLIQKKQIDWVQSAPVLVQNFTTSATNSDNVTATITTALSSAGRNGVAVPLQISTDEDTQGVIVGGDFARIEIWNAANQDKIAGDDDNNEVYGRLTESTGTYTLSYYYLTDAGVETAYTFASPTAINFSFNYRFCAYNVPADAAIGLITRQISQDPGGNRQKMRRERLTVSATNTLSDLSVTIADPTQLELVVNGVTYYNSTGEPVTLTGQTPGWNPTAFGAGKSWDVVTSDTVFAIYPTNA